MADTPKSQTPNLRLVGRGEPAESLADADRERIAALVRRIDGLIDIAVGAAEKRTQALATMNVEGEIDALSIDDARAAKTWVDVRRGLLESHPGLLRLTGSSVDTQPKVDREELADAIEALLTAVR